jgi:hypothetical protein
VRDRLIEWRDAFAIIAGHRVRVKSLAGRNGGDPQAREWRQASSTASRHLRWFADKQIVVRDIERGLVDFPATREGQKIFLCWRLGEDSVAFWHGTNQGFAGRQPL